MNQQNMTVLSFASAEIDVDNIRKKIWICQMSSQQVLKTCRSRPTIQLPVVENRSAHSDEFLYYEDIWRAVHKAPRIAKGVNKNVNKKQSEAFSLMTDSIQALMRENKDVLWGSMIKQTMQRKRPSFNEGYYGYSTFSELLEDAESKNFIKLKRDQRSGTYIVTQFATSK